MAPDIEVEWRFISVLHNGASLFIFLSSFLNLKKIEGLIGILSEIFHGFSL